MLFTFEDQYQQSIFSINSTLKMEAIAGLFENMGCIYQTKMASQMTSTLLLLQEPHI
jgi:hypothetical protein